MAGILKTVPGGSPSPSPPAQASNFFKAMAELDLCTTRDKYGLFHLLTVRRDLDVYRETLAAAKERLAAAPHPGGVSTRNAPGVPARGLFMRSAVTQECTIILPKRGMCGLQNRLCELIK